MTDIPSSDLPVPARLGVGARVDERGELRLHLRRQPDALHHGVVRASVLAFLVDAAAGIPIDGDPDSWSLTSDMTVRARAVPAPERIDATSTVLRQGRRSVTCRVELTAGDGITVGTGAIGFVRVPRRDGDPPKPSLTPETVAAIFPDRGTLTRPLRDEAGIEVVDPAAGVVQVAVTPELRNPAGTLQGAMVALVAEAAAEDLVATRFESPVVVTELDLRYLGQAPGGTVRTRSRLLGTGPDAPVEVELVDASSGRLTTLAYARAVAVS